MFRFFCLGILAAVLAAGAAAQDTQYQAKSEQIPAPECLNLHFAWEHLLQSTCPPGTHESWLRDLQHWRSERRVRIGYDPSRYLLPELQWTQSSFIQPQMMVQDRYFYDPGRRQYTWIVISMTWKNATAASMRCSIWPTYPNMGIDNRNQQDMVAPCRAELPACGRWLPISIAAASGFCFP